MLTRSPHRSEISLAGTRRIKRVRLAFRRAAWDDRDVVLSLRLLASPEGCQAHIGKAIERPCRRPPPSGGRLTLYRRMQVSPFLPRPG